MTDPNTLGDLSMPEGIDEWLDQPTWEGKCTSGEAYARFVLEYFRYPAWKISLYKAFMVGHKLFCTYAGTTYRVTGASRLGDVWLARDLERTTGYDYRVSVGDCTEWRAAP